jgi:hypothetical protein
MYTAAVLTEDSVKTLEDEAKQVFDLTGFEFSTPAGSKLPHHMTINLGQFDENLNNPDILGKNCILSIQELLICDKIGVCAAKVLTAKFGTIDICSTNIHKHITICLKPPNKPVRSNELFTTEGVRKVELDHLIHLNAIIEEV